MQPTKIAYLFGAGATHAEILNLEDSPSDNFKDENGLLISGVSKRVMRRAQSNPRFKKGVREVTYRSGPVNIELLISLFESNRIPDADVKVKYLKKWVQDDISRILSSERKRRFCLHRGLLELHWLIENRETLIGIISLNYDDVLDQAYTNIFRHKPNYCHTSSRGEGIPLLKLHGSFNWNKIKIYGRAKTIPIIPLGINKNYLIPPYNFIWSRAFEVLIQCDILRVIGCSLSQNDIGLVDLLFKVHLERGRHLDIEIINSQEQGERIKYDYGFFPGIITPKDIEGSLIADDLTLDPEISNPFKIWLRAKAQRVLDEAVDRTRYLRRCS